VAGLDEVRIPVRAVERSQEAVDPVARITVEPVHAPFAEPLQDVVADELGHVTTPSFSLESGGSRAAPPANGQDGNIGPLLGTPRIHVQECKSTQLLLLDSNLPEGAVATADHQTGGRGRLGRVWVETPGSPVLCSVLLRPPAGRAVAQLSLVGGLAVAEAVEGVSGLPALIKWPNDVLVEGRKMAGVLAEQRGAAVVLGIGINVNQAEACLPADARVPA